MNDAKAKSVRANALLVDASLCIGCFSCQVACKLEHDLPAGPRNGQGHSIGSIRAGRPPLHVVSADHLFSLRATRMRRGMPDRSHAEAGGRHSLFRS